MKNSKMQFFAFTLAIIFVFCSFFIKKLDSELDSNTKWRNYIVNLKLLNEEIDMYFKDSFAKSNYDHINIILSKFNTIITKLNKVDGFAILDELYGSKNDLLTIQKIYSKKLSLVDEFDYINSSATSFLIDSKLSIKQDPYLKAFEHVLFKVENIDFRDIYNIKMVGSELEELKTKLKASGDYRASAEEISKKIKYILSVLEESRELYKQNVILNLTSYLENILIAYDYQYNKVMDLLDLFTLLAFLAFAFLFMLIILKDIRHKKNIEKMAMFKFAVDNSHDSVIFTNERNKISYVNKSFEKITGYDMEDIKDKSPSILKSCLHSEAFYDDIRHSINKFKKFECEELISKTKDGEYIYEKVDFWPFRLNDIRLGYVGIKSDKTHETSVVRELEFKSEQLKAQSTIDRLTGFGNYFAMSTKLDLNQDGIVVNINIKNFNNLRFFYKTKIIEAMLLSFANTLKLCVDTLDIKAELFRFQDDEFHVWYTGDDVVKDMSYIQDYFGFNSLNINIDNKIESLPGIKAIIGVSLQDDTIQTNRLMQAILANQQAHKLSSEIYYYKENDAIELRYYKNQMTTQLIEYALEHNTVIVECQPIFDVTSEKEEVAYYEILVRIIDQNGKIRYPGEFLDVAVQTQLYTRITKKVIEHGFLLVERYPKYTFSINLSGLDIIDSSVREFLEEKLQLCSDTSRICFEVLESEEFNDYAIVNSFIKHIKSYGSKISIDDFGSGYSNYYRILELDIDTIKIDGSIIKKLPFDQNAQYLVETIINFASKQGYKVVAEFVSTPEILEQVKRFGIPYAQGFLLGKPQATNSL